MTKTTRVSIAEVSSVLGVPMPTLRSWELRYGLPTFSRPVGQHRRYLPAEVHAIKLMRDEIARGEQAGLAAATVRRLLDIGGPAGAFIQQFLERSHRLDAVGVWETLDHAADALGLGPCVDEVLFPSMRQVGIWWAVGHCDVAQERATTEAVRAWLGKRTAFAPAPTGSRPVLLACGPSDWHTIGIESLAMLLRHAGLNCRVLGARIPTDLLVAAAASSDAAAVVLVSQLATGRRLAVGSIGAVSEAKLPIFYAGSSFIVSRSRVGVPGVYLGTRVVDACTRVVDAVADAR